MAHVIYHHASSRFPTNLLHIFFFKKNVDATSIV